MSRAVAALALALALLAGGCGSSSIARDDFLARGNAVCINSAARIARLAAPPNAARSSAAHAGYVDAYVAEMLDQLAHLRKLGYPDGDRAVLAATYDSLRAVLLAAQRAPATFEPQRLAVINGQLRGRGLTACRT